MKTLYAICFIAWASFVVFYLTGTRRFREMIGNVEAGK